MMTPTTKPKTRRKLPARFEALMRRTGRDVSATRSVIATARAADRFSNEVEGALVPTSLTGTRFSVLMELASSPGGQLPLCEIGRRLVRGAPNVTGLIDRMQAAGLVRRVPDETDRRVVLAEITEEGWAVLPAAAGAVFAAERRMLTGLNATERAQLVTLLERTCPSQGD